MVGSLSLKNVEIPRLVAIETTNRCNATCSFCPNNVLSRNRHTMSDELFEKIIEDCREFKPAAIEPFLNGEPFMDKKIMSRMALIRTRLPDTKLRLYSNGSLLKPRRIDDLVGLGIDHLFISLNTLNPQKYKEVIGLSLEKTLNNLRYLTEDSRRLKVARKITFRMTRTEDTTVAEQKAFVAFCKQHNVRPMIVGLFNYKDFGPSSMPVPGFPCEHITRLDVLSSGRVTLCCMDHEGEYPWGDVNEMSVLEAYNSEAARRYREYHRTGRRKDICPCDDCNLFWPAFDHTTIAKKIQFGVEAGLYFAKHRPTGIKRVS